MSSIRCKSIHAPAAPDDGLRLLITRYHPRGVSKNRYDEWHPELAPSMRLLADYKAGLSWEEFEKRLRRELDGNEAAWSTIRELARMSQRGEPVTLLCHEPSGEKCHRYMIRALACSLY